MVRVVPGEHGKELDGEAKDRDTQHLPAKQDGQGQVTKDVEVEDADPWPDAASRKLEAATATCARWSVLMYLVIGAVVGIMSEEPRQPWDGNLESGIWIWISSEGKPRGPTNSADDSSHVAADLMHKLLD